MSEIKLSVVIITFNEEKNIERCLTSVKDIADEIVVVDSFSTDKTAEICQKFNVRFIPHKFDGHIEQKNWAITQALFPHILSLDADEALDETLKKNILDVKKNWQFDGYEMNRLTNYCGKWIKHCGWYPDKKLRLWDSRKGKWGGTNPHDKFELENKKTKAGFLNGDILHYSFYTIEDHIKQINYFSDIASKALHNKGKKTSFVNLCFSPAAKFISNYFLQLGFLDGYYGFVISKQSAKHTYLKYKKLQLLNRK